MVPGCIAERGKRRGGITCSWCCSGDGGQQRTGRTDRECGTHAAGEHAAQQFAAIDAGHGWVLLSVSAALPCVPAAGLLVVAGTPVYGWRMKSIAGSTSLACLKSKKLAFSHDEPVPQRVLQLLLVHAGSQYTTPAPPVSITS